MALQYRIIVENERLAMNVKIKKEDYPVIAAMKLGGARWSDIATIYGCSVGHLKNMSKEILSGWSDEKVSIKRFALAKIMHICLTAKDSSVQLKAAIALHKYSKDEPAQSFEEQEAKRKADTQRIVNEILETLRSA